MPNKIDVREIISRFQTLKYHAKRHTNAPDSCSIELDLHEAALAYAAAVRRVARRGRDS